jgi:hypothetical protein
MLREINMLDEKIQRLVEIQEELSGIDTRKLKPGTQVKAWTKNSVYEMEIVNCIGDVLVQGGKYFPQLTPTTFTGSTWGGSMLKIGWIGYMMSMEFQYTEKNKIISTTFVRKAKIIGENYEYEMDWPIPNIFP